MTARLLSGARGPFRGVFAGTIASSAAASLDRLPAELAPASAHLLDQLTDELACLAAPTLLRTFSRRPQRRLPDADRRADHDSYCRWLESGGLDDVLDLHPGLAEILEAQIVRWHDRTAELVRVVSSQSQALSDHFAFRAPVVAVHPLVNGSLRLVDARGSSLIWKRRSVAIDIAFARLLSQIGSHSDDPLTVGPPMVDLGSSGLCGIVDQRPPRSPREWSRLAEQFGTLLAITTMLGGTDLHVHNVLIDQGRPVLIDAEAVIRPPWDDDDRRPSVIGTGLVPADGYLSESGLAASLGMRHPTPWCDLDTDAVRQRPVRPTQRARSAEARRAFARVDPTVATGIVDAFARTVRRILAEGLPLELFESTRPRVLLRPSVGYEDTMLAAIDPDVVIDANGPASLVQRHLAPPPPPLIDQPELAAEVRRSEGEALCAFVFPRFSMPASGGSLWCGDTDLGLTAPFESPLDRARHLLDSTTADDVGLLIAELTEALGLLRRATIEEEEP